MWNSNEPSPPSSIAIIDIAAVAIELWTGNARRKKAHGIEIKFSIYGNFVFWPKIKKRKNTNRILA